SFSVVGTVSTSSRAVVVDSSDETTRDSGGGGAQPTCCWSSSPICTLYSAPSTTSNVQALCRVVCLRRVPSLSFSSVTSTPSRGGAPVSRTWWSVLTRTKRSTGPWCPWASCSVIGSRVPSSTMP